MTASGSIARAASLRVALALALLAPGARADLAPAFATKLTLDTAYVTGISQPTDIAFSGDGRAVVTTKTGSVVVRNADGTLTTVPYPFPGTLDTDSEKGLLGVVADPDVLHDGAFYFYVSNGPTEDKHRVYRAVLTAADGFVVDPNPIVGAARGTGPGLQGPANHDGGGMIIHGGRLYVGVGDTGFNATPPTNRYASCLDKGNGKILRVNLDGSVPADNPLVGLSSVTACASELAPFTTAPPDTRVFAWGLRNPWRFWVDPRTSLLWIGDVGEATEEEISVGGGNQHYGYPFVEGSSAWGDVGGKSCETLSPGRPCTPPVFSYSHAVGLSVTGGLIPSACGWEKALGGPAYVYGDYVAGFVRILPVDAAHRGLARTTPTDLGTFPGLGPVSFRMGPDGALYVVFYSGGAVYRLSPTMRTGAGCTAPVPAAPRRRSLLLFALLFLAGLALLFAVERRLSRTHPAR